MILDGHIHIEHLGSDSESMMERMNSCGIDGGVMLSAMPGYGSPEKEHDPEGRMDDVLRRCSGNPNLYPFFWVDPMEENAAEQVGLAVKKGIRGFKEICRFHYPYDPKAMEVYKEIARTGLPMLFHSGILYGKGYSRYSQPVGFEQLLDIPNFRFALAHVSWPWCDEVLAMFGRYSYFSNKPGHTAELFIDITPGVPILYRREVFQKIFRLPYNFSNNLFFGLDCVAEDYDINRARTRMAVDNGLYHELGVAADVMKNIYSDNLLRFLSG